MLKEIKIAKTVTRCFNIISGRSTRNIGGTRTIKRELNSMMDKREDKVTGTAGGS
jgi:hypothetical protein